MAKRLCLIFGANGSGKGTVSDFVVNNYDYKHLSAGNCLRDWAEKFDSNLFKLLDNGDFVDDQITKKALELKIESFDKNDKVIVDGYPRRKSQIPIFKDICDKYDYKPEFIIVLNLPLEIILERVKDRVMGPDGTVYHLKLNPPPADLDPKLLTTRADDKPEIVIKRYEHYMNHTTEILSDPYFKDVKICSIDATLSIPEVRKKTAEFIDEFNRQNQI